MKPHTTARAVVWLAVSGLALQAAAQDVTLNLKDADISALIDAVANITKRTSSSIRPCRAR